MGYATLEQTIRNREAIFDDWPLTKRCKEFISLSFSFRDAYVRKLASEKRVLGEENSVIFASFGHRLHILWSILKNFTWSFTTLGYGGLRSVMEDMMRQLYVQLADRRDPDYCQRAEGLIEAYLINVQASKAEADRKKQWDKVYGFGNLKQ